MATPNPDENFVTKQITIAAFHQYVKKMEDTSPSVAEVPPLSNSSDSTCPPTASSPLGSPSAITPTLEHGDLWSVPSQPQHRQTFESLILQEGTIIDIAALTRDQGNMSQELNRTTNLVVDRLKIIGDEFDTVLRSRRPVWSVISYGLVSSDESVLQKFSHIISTLKKELSLRMIVRIFYFGYRLLTAIHPLDYYGEQQRKMLSVFTDFLLNELSEWIDEQGGWENILFGTRAHSYSTSDLPDHESNIILDDITPTDEVLPEDLIIENCPTPPSTRSQSLSENRRPTSMSMSIPRGGRRTRPETLPLNISHSYPRQHSREHETPSTPPPTTGGSSRGSLSSVVSFGVGVSFGIALCSFFFSK